MIRALSGILIAGLVWAALASSREAAASQDLMYIPLGSAGEVVVVDTSQDKVVGRIKGLPAIHGLAGTPDGKLLIAGSFQEREPGDAVPAKPAGMSEEDHAAHHARPADTGPRLKAVVSTVSVVRTADGSMVRRIDVPGAVHHVAVDPTGRLAVVTHPNQDSISVIDLDSFELVATVESGPLPNYAVFSPGGNRIFVSNAGNDTISIVDAWSWTVQRQIKVGSSPEHLVLSPDGATLYVNNVNGGSVSVVSVSSNEVVQVIPIGEVLHGIDLSEDGKTLFVTALGEDKLVAVRLGSSVARGISLAPAPYHLAAVRGTGKLYVSSADEPKVWVVDQRDLKVLGEIAIGGKGHQMVQAPGG